MARNPGAIRSRLTWKAGVLLAFFAGLWACHSDPSPSSAQASGWDAPSTEAAVLVGTVRDPRGQPISGALVTTYGGLATRFPIDSTQTDEQGRYRFVLGGGLLSSPGWDGPARSMVGVCVGSVSNGNPAEFLPWKDVWFDSTAGVVTRLDFVFDQDALPMDKRR